MTQLHSSQDYTFIRTVVLSDEAVANTTQLPQL